MATLLLPAADVYDALTLAPSELTSRLRRIEESGHSLFPVLGLIAGGWLALRPDDDLPLSRKLLVTCIGTALLMSNCTIRFRRTGNEQHVLFPLLTAYLPGLSLFFFILALRNTWLSRCWRYLLPFACTDGRQHEHGQGEGSDLEQSAAPEQRSVYQQLSRLIDLDAVWEALDDANILVGKRQI